MDLSKPTAAFPDIRVSLSMYSFILSGSRKLQEIKQIESDATCRQVQLTHLVCRSINPVLKLQLQGHVQGHDNKFL